MRHFFVFQRNIFINITFIYLFYWDIFYKILDIVFHRFMGVPNFIFGLTNRFPFIKTLLIFPEFLLSFPL